MRHTRKDHYLFLEEELQAQTDAFLQKLNTSASYLLNVREELFIAQFVKFADGELILKFNNGRGVPRKGEYLYCFTTPKHLHDYRAWGNVTYGELIKNKGFSTELVCIWQSSLRDNPQYCLVGFRGTDLDFAEHIAGHAGAFLILGPNIPPYQYISNLQKIVKDNHSELIEKILEADVDEARFSPQPIPKNFSITNFIINQLSLTDSVIIQGPPGTGKTYQIAKLCNEFCRKGFSVLVTSLTNRALIEVASKDEIKELLNEGKVYKTKMSVDESKELPLLKNIKQLYPEKGSLILSTFYITSGEANNVTLEQPFDVVIMDEASQALLSMFAAAILLGRKTIFVGDPNQMPPVLSMNADRITRRNYHPFVDGIVSMNSIDNIPTYCLTTTYRLPQRAASYTGIFYDNMLVSAQEKEPFFVYSNLPQELNRIICSKGGPSMIKVDMPLGDKKPQSILLLTTMLVSAFLSQKEKLHISVLSSYVETTKALQKAVFQSVGNHNNLLIDTVSRIQGLTTDITIYVIPNTGYSFSLNRRLFNVATSRARRHTIIICDTQILSQDTTFVDPTVLKFLSRLSESQHVAILQQTIVAKPLLETYNNEIPIENQMDDDSHSNTRECDEHKVKLEEFSEGKVDKQKIGVKIVGHIDLSKFQTKRIRERGKFYIIDTNVFVDCPDICQKLGKDNQIILSAKVIDELDKLKITLEGDDRHNVGKALGIINKSLNWPNVIFEVADLNLLPVDFSRKSPDNMILSVALKYKDNYPILITSDNGLQIKCKGLGIQTVSLKEFQRSKN